MTTELYEQIVKQAPTPGGFICERCVSYRGGVSCANNVFISTVGATMTACALFRDKDAIGPHWRVVEREEQAG